MSNDSNHLSLVKTDKPRTHPALPKWAPLIAPSTPARGPGDDDDDDDFEDVSTLIRQRRPPVAAVETEQGVSRLEIAVSYARHAMEREGLDLRTAAERAVMLHGVSMTELLEALRVRKADGGDLGLPPPGPRPRGPSHCAVVNCWRQAMAGGRYCPAHVVLGPGRVG